DGTLRVGDAFVSGIHFGHVRAMINDRGQKVERAGPSTPVEVIGFSSVPSAGETFVVVTDEKKAKELANQRMLKQRELELAKTSKVTLEDFYKKMQKGVVKDLNLILKGDVQGSIEALSEALKRLSTDAVHLNILHDIRLYNVIYDALDDVRKAMEGLLEPIYEEKQLGRAQVRQVFRVSKVGVIAGSFVQEGKIVRGSRARLVRAGKGVHEGTISSLKRLKDDVREVASGFECGIGLGDFQDILTNDIIEVFTVEKTTAHL
ncbi:MAG: translation initiation factor IF-2, partial [Deltaproteobacteria bacterium]|nr:translation initiation factor IF-2 [Deltaproteobacteria bacterium]